MEPTTETKRAAKPSNHEMVNQLKKEAASNPVFNAICYVFAMRERARQQVTMASLQATLAKEGFLFETKKLEESLRFLAHLGIGRLETDKKGVRALKDIKITLQSVGQCALSDEKGSFLKNMRLSNKFTKLNSLEIKPTTAEVLVAAPPVELKSAPETKSLEETPVETTKRQPPAGASASAFPERRVRQTQQYPVSITTVVNGKEVTIPIPVQLTPEQIGAAIMSIFERTRKP